LITAIYRGGSQASTITTITTITTALTHPSIAGSQERLVAVLITITITITTITHTQPPAFTRELNFVNL
jgi:hypothetical protein